MSTLRKINTWMLTSRHSTYEIIATAIYMQFFYFKPIPVWASTLIVWAIFALCGYFRPTDQARQLTK